jgi:hypothetical protein
MGARKKFYGSGKNQRAPVARGDGAVARALRRGDRRLAWLERMLFDEASFREWCERSRVTLEDMKAMTLTPEDIKDLTP